jgi:Fic family protein
MRGFDYSGYKDRLWDAEVVGYLTAIHEYRGKQALYLRQKEATLSRLVELAKVQSTEASNAIEGIRTTETRLRQLVAQKTTPRNRDEREILGYRDALSVVHESFEHIPITPNYILQLHKIMLSHTGSSYAGRFKDVQNYISATDAQGRRSILFTPLTPYETPTAMQALCDAYNLAVGEGAVDPLLLIPSFIHDFLCVHPFIDGNGRMSRLLTTLLLYRSGYYVGRYVSLEAKISRSKDCYYDALQQSQTGWHEGAADQTPFIKYILGTVVGAYRDFEDRVALVDEKPSAVEAVRVAVCQKIGPFKKADVLELCPALSAASVERSLKALCQSGEISKHGNGRATYYLRETL